LEKKKPRKGGGGAGKGKERGEGSKKDDPMGEKSFSKTDECDSVGEPIARSHRVSPHNTKREEARRGIGGNTNGGKSFKARRPIEKGSRDANQVLDSGGKDHESGGGFPENFERSGR